jgi:hypothetical protein
MDARALRRREDALKIDTRARAALATAVVCAVIATSNFAAAQETAAAQEEDEKEFGDPGVVVLGGALHASYSKATNDGHTNVSKGLGTAASADVFVARGLSFGLSGSFTTGRSSTELPGGTIDYTSYVGGGALRVGYYVPLGPRVGLWPMISAGVMHAEVHTDIAMVGPTDGNMKQLSVLANILFHVDHGWFLSVTPGMVAYSTSTNGVAMSALGGVGVPYVGLGFGGWL